MKLVVYWGVPFLTRQASKTKSSDLLKSWSFSMRKKFHKLFQLMCLPSWRNGSASDFSSEGCVFNSCQGQNECLQLFCYYTLLSWQLKKFFLFKNNFIYFQNSLNFFWLPTGPCDKIVWSVFSSHLGQWISGVVCLGNMLDRTMEPAEW